MYERVNPGHSTTTQESSQCTDLPPVPAARQLGLAADSDRPQAEAAKARSGPERVLPTYSPCSDPRDRETNSSRFRPVSSGVLNLRKRMNRRSGSPGDLRNRSDSAAIGIGSVGRASRTRRRCSAAVKTPGADRRDASRVNEACPAPAPGRYQGPAADSSTNQ